MSTILNFLPAEGYKREAGTSGGEWAGSCPKCGGRDRFRVWPDHPSGDTGGRFLCRGCGWTGDGIQFLRDRDSMTYPDACKAFSVEPRSMTKHDSREPRAAAWQPRPAAKPVEQWQKQADRFVASCAAAMAPDTEGLAYAFARGLTAETVARLRIGWNPADRWEDRAAWGLPPEQNDKGNPKKVWLPAGLVIPSRRRAGIVAVKVRRSAWAPEDTLPKYAAVSGSTPGLALGGGNGRPVAVVESEIDAVLVHQEAGDLVGALALGTASGKPDADAAAYLRTAPSILVALDFDRAGIEAFPWWREHFQQSRPWPTPEGKDVGDLIGVPGYVRAWVEAAFIIGPTPVLWPRPEPGPVETTLSAGRYACLEALASYFGAGLVRDSGGRLALTFPPNVRPEPAQAIRDGFAELKGYITTRIGDSPRA